MPDNVIGLISTIDNKDLNRGEKEYNAVMGKMVKTTKSSQDAMESFSRTSSKEFKDFEKKSSQSLSAAQSALKKYNSVLAASERSIAGRFSRSAVSIGQNLTVGVTLPLAAAGAAGVKAFSSLNEAINATNVVFGEASKILIDYSQTAATSVGLSRRAFLQAATPLGAQLRNMGYSAEEAADQTVILTQRAADLASIFDTDVSDALAAIQSGLRGEINPLERYGVGLSAAAVSSYALAEGIAEAGKELTDQQKIVARIGLLMEQTNAVQGDFTRTIGDMANASRSAKAQLEDAATVLGEKLIPFVQKGITSLTSLIDAFNSLSPEAQDAAIYIAAIAAGIGPALIGVGKLVQAYNTLNAALTAVNISTKAFIGTIGLWTVAIGLAVVAAQKTKNVWEDVEEAGERTQRAFQGTLEKSATSIENLIDTYVDGQRRAKETTAELGTVAKILAVTQQEEIRNLDGLSKALIPLTGSYDEYVKAILQAQVASGMITEEYARLIATHPTLEQGFKNLGIVAKEDYDIFLDLATNATDLSAIFPMLKTAVDDVNDSTQNVTTSTLDAEYGMSAWATAIENTTKASSSYLDGLREIVDESQVQFAVQGRLQDISDKYRDTMEDLTDEHEDLLRQKQELIDRGYSEEGQKIQDLNDALSENERKQREAKEAADEATASLIYQAAVAGLEGDAGAQLELARALGLVSEKDYELIKATDELTRMYQDTGDIDAYTMAMKALNEAAEDGRDLTAAIKAILEGLDGQTFKTYLQVTTQGSYPTGYIPQDVDEDKIPRQMGGRVYKDNLYLVGESGRELFIPSSDGEVVTAQNTNMLLSGGRQTSGGGIGSVGGGITSPDSYNLLSNFTDIDYSIFEDAQDRISDAITRMIDAGTIGEEEGLLMYQRLSEQLIEGLSQDAPLTEESLANLTAGLDDFGDEIANVTAQQQRLLEAEQRVEDAEAALDAAREAGVGEDAAEAALDAAREQEETERNQLDLLERQLDALMKQKDLENEIKKIQQEQEEERRRAAEQAAEEERRRQEQAISDAERAADEASKRLENAQDEYERYLAQQADAENRAAEEQKRLAQEELKLAQDMEIEKAQDAVDAARDALDEISESENKANLQKQQAVMEYNRMLREGASQEELDRQKALIEAADEEIAQAKEQKSLAEETLETEQQNLEDTQERISDERQAQREKELAEERATAEAEAEAERVRLEEERTRILAELGGAQIDYNRAVEELMALLGRTVVSPIETGGVMYGGATMSSIGGQQAERSIVSSATRTMSVDMTNQIANGMDLAMVISAFKTMMRQEFTQ